VASPTLIIELLAGIKTVFEATKATIDLARTLEKYRSDPEVIAEANRVSLAFSTYSDEEIQYLVGLIEGCRSRFMEQGSGENRARCLCAVFKEIMAGNGGVLPRIDDWENIHRQLACGRFDRGVTDLRDVDS